MKNIQIFAFLIFVPAIFSQSTPEDYYHKFIKCLISNNEKVIDYIDISEIEASNRLGIQYEDVKHKFLISYDIDENVKKGIREGKLEYSLTTQILENQYSELIFKVGNIDYQKEFYFKNQKHISPITYFTRNWPQIKNKHFNFVISDTTLFNSYCIQNLENYFITIAELLDLGENQLKTIEQEKIYYFLCKDQDDIELVTGFRTRGMYILAYDFIVTTFNAHYHELLHLLINYKLQTLPLYTLPFLQEGFAVAFGGRGGKEPNIILNLGLFLNNSGMLDYNEILTKKGFYNVDVSLSYPMSGIYNIFLLEQIGLDKYLKLYIKYSGESDEVEKMKVRITDLPSADKWNEFIRNKKFSSLELWKNDIEKNPIKKCKSALIFKDSDKYYFAVKDTLFLLSDEMYSNYDSKKYNEIIKGRKYGGEKYLITVNENEIAVYNLFTNNLIANFVISFSVPFSPVTKQNGYYKFKIHKDIFDEKLNGIQLLSN